VQPLLKIENLNVHYGLNPILKNLNLTVESDQIVSIVGPILSPSSTSDKVTQIGDYVFRACYVDSFQGIAMANFAFDSLKAKTAALLVDMDMDHSRDVSEVFKSEFEKRGGKVLKTVTFSGNHDTSYVPQLTELRNLKADVIYSPVYYSRMGVLFKQVRTFQIKSQILGTDAWDSHQLFKLAAGATSGALLTDPFSYQNPAKHIQDFRNKFKTQYGMEPSSYGALAYDSVFVLENALSKMPWPPSQTRLAKAIREVHAFQSSYGHLPPQTGWGLF
jgi:branched-chain amino acid transport system substrate-binding protein